MDLYQLFPRYTKGRVWMCSFKDFDQAITWIVGRYYISNIFQDGWDKHFIKTKFGQTFIFPWILLQSHVITIIESYNHKSDFLI